MTRSRNDRVVEEIETQRTEFRGLLKEAIRRSVVPVVVVCPVLAVCWQVSENLPLGWLSLGQVSGTNAPQSMVR